MSTINKLILTIVLSIACYAIWVFISGYEEVAAGVRQVGIDGLIYLLLLSLVNYLLRFWRWHWMLYKVTGVKVPLWPHLLCYVSGFALTATPGKVGEALRSVYLKPYGVKVPDSLAALFAERLIDLIAVLLIGGLALARFEEYRWIGVIIIAVVLAAAVLVRSRHVLVFLENKRAFFKGEKISGLYGHFVDAIEAASRFMAWRIWLVGLFWGVLAWGAEAWGFVLLVKWLTGEEWVFLASGIYALSMVVGALSFLPGGLGGAEVVMAGMLVALGTSMSDAATATIICRVVTLWFAVVLGLLVLGRFQLSLSAEEKLKS